MIYVLKKEDLLYITENPRQEDEKNGGYNEELIYTFDSLTLTHEIKIKLRPWNCFWLEDKNYYRLELLQHINRILGSNSGCSSYVEMPESEKTKYLKLYDDAFIFLEIPKKQEINKSGIKYFCDIFNVLSEEYGHENINLVKEYVSLPEQDKKFLANLKNFNNKNKKLEYSRTYNGNLDNLIPFLPDFIIEDYIIFDSKLKTSDDQPIPPFLDNSPLENISLHKKLEDLIYSEFTLGEYVSGQEVKLKLFKIYKSLGINKTPKVQDIFEFFNVTRSNIQNSSSYRLDTRKII